MKRVLAIGLVAVAVIGVAVLGLRIGTRHDAAVSPVKLVSASITLPGDAAALPAGPHVDLVTARCTACHSAEMILTQPALSPAQWQAEIVKMREVYRAPVPARDEPALLAYLTALSAAGTPRTREPS